MKGTKVRMKDEKKIEKANVHMMCNVQRAGMHIGDIVLQNANYTNFKVCTLHYKLQLNNQVSRIKVKSMIS